VTFRALRFTSSSTPDAKRDGSGSFNLELRKSGGLDANRSVSMGAEIPEIAAGGRSVTLAVVPRIKGLTVQVVSHTMCP